MSDRLARIEAIVKQAAELPKIEPLPANPSHREVLDGYVKLAYAYAASTTLLQQTLPLIVEELQVVHTELALQQARKRKRKTVPLRTAVRRKRPT